MAASGDASEAAMSCDVMLDGVRRFDLRATVAWVDGFGLSIWAYYGLEAMEVPRRVLQRMLRANFDYPFVKFALTDDDRPMLVTELPPAGLDRDLLGRALTRLTVVADRLLEETASAVADRGLIPDWSDRTGRNPELLAAYRADAEATMPAWAPQPEPPRRRGLLARLLGGSG
ncbi:MAG: YbjN domain-containing protein [Chloroflexi bacterium]|nr:MAG: YbjN domain-containing protein [Chloroflexota bacterium]